jgi:hypothetical protein
MFEAYHWAMSGALDHTVADTPQSILATRVFVRKEPDDEEDEDGDDGDSNQSFDDDDDNEGDEGYSE